MSNETLFSKIIRREIPATIVYEDDEVLGFKDIAPQAPVHVLFIPKNEIIPTLDDLQPSQAHLIGKLALAAAEYARREGFAQDGYRIVMNCREDAGQTVFHIHMHLLAGAPVAITTSPNGRNHPSTGHTGPGPTGHRGRAPHRPGAVPATGRSHRPTASAGDSRTPRCGCSGSRRSCR